VKIGLYVCKVGTSRRVDAVVKMEPAEADDDEDEIPLVSNE